MIYYVRLWRGPFPISTSVVVVALDKHIRWGRRMMRCCSMDVACAESRRITASQRGGGGSMSIILYTCRMWWCAEYKRGERRRMWRKFHHPDIYSGTMFMVWYACISQTNYTRNCPTYENKQTNSCTTLLWRFIIGLYFTFRKIVHYFVYICHFNVEKDVTRKLFI